MSKRHLCLVALAAIGLAVLTGCVERKMLIRSDPPGAPAWLDEEPVGETPTEVEFYHYGTRRVRVGPVRNEEDTVVHTEAERLLHMQAPWYEVFPIGFISEVIWPFQITDRRVVEFELEPAQEEAVDTDEKAAREALDKARSFREKALSPEAGTR